MAKIYSSGQFAQDLNLVAHGGVTIILTNAQELSVLIRMLRLLPRPPEDPLGAVFKALSDPAFSWEAWRTYIEAEEKQPTSGQPDLDSGSSEDLPRSEFHQLMIALSLAAKVWENADDDAPQLVAGVMIASRESSLPSSLSLQGQGAILALYPGSILAQIAKLPFSALSWLVCLALGGGTTPTARAPRAVQELRARHLKRVGKPLKSIFELEKIPQPKRPLAVVVHGLFQTDVGCLGPLQEKLEAVYGENLAGFPHETVMTSVKQNGEELAQELRRLLPEAVVVFAYSRGGLVARMAAVALKRQSKIEKRKELSGLIRYCVTFGTPHNGATLAQNPGFLAAALVVGNALRSGMSFLVDALCCFSTYGRFPGISDLQPSGAQESVLHVLQEEEGLFPNQLTGLFAFGGNLKPKKWWERIACYASSRLISEQPNDWVIEVSSSMPKLLHRSKEDINRPPVLQCSHFDYWDEFNALEASYSNQFPFWVNPLVNEGRDITARLQSCKLLEEGDRSELKVAPSSGDAPPEKDVP